jgi:uncharacterized Zn-binding protein involved in type VI secretion
MLKIFSLVLMLASGVPSGAPPTPKPALKQVACPVMQSGSTNVLVEGKPAGRLGDGSCVVAVQGSTNVMINGLPALTLGSPVICKNGKTGVIVGGASSVIINGKPAAGLGSHIVGCDR